MSLIEGYPLQNCPFCNSEAHLIGYIKAVSINCTNCPASMNAVYMYPNRKMTIEELVRNWNTRMMKIAMS